MNWKWEELVLACDLVMQNDGRILEDTDPRVIELSGLLRRMTLHLMEDRLPTFRIPNGVAQKTRNLVQHLPSYTGSTSRGSKLDREVVKRFIAEPDTMHAEAASVRAMVAAGEPLEQRTIEVGDDLTPDRLERILSRLRIYRREGIPALYQPITLLWAFSRARRGEPRLVSWPETQRQVKALLSNYGRDWEGDRVFYPIAALHNAGLWELDADPGQVPSAHGSSVPQRWFEDHQPNGGLPPPVYDLLRESPDTLNAAVNVLAKNYFTDAEAMLLSEFGLPGSEVTSPLEMSFAARVAAYQRLCARADGFWHDRDTKRAARTSSAPVRSQDAREGSSSAARATARTPNAPATSRTAPTAAPHPGNRPHPGPGPGRRRRPGPDDRLLPEPPRPQDPWRQAVRAQANPASHSKGPPRTPSLVSGGSRRA